MPQTEEQKQAALAEGRRIANENRRLKAQQAQQQPETEQQIRYAYICKRRMKVGDEFREPGELIPEAATWSTLQRYISLGWVEIGLVINGAFQKLPTPPNPNERLLEELLPEAPAKPVPLGAQYAGEGLVEVQCFNCRHVNHLAKELLENQASEWRCFRCNQDQTVEQAGAYPVQDRREYDRQAGFHPQGQQSPATKTHIEAHTPVDLAHPIPGR